MNNVDIYLERMYLQENVNVTKLIKISISKKVDHIMFEIFSPDGNIQAFFLDDKNNEVQFPSISCGKTKFAKNLFGKQINKNEKHYIIKQIAQEIEKAGANKLKIETRLMIHDDNDVFQISKAKA